MLDAKNRIGTYQMLVIGFAALFLLLCGPTGFAHAGTIVLVGTSTATAVQAPVFLPLNSLQGGIANSPSQGDLILIVNATASTSNGFTAPGVIDSGYKEIADLYGNDTQDVNLSVNWAIATSGPNTGVTCERTGVGIGNVCFAMVFRGVDPGTPIDVSTTTSPTASPINGQNINCLPTAASTTGSLFVCLGAAGGSTFTAGTTVWPAGWVQAASTSRGQAGTRTVVAFGIFSTTTAEEGQIGDPPAFSYTLGTAGQDSWAAVGLSLRPDQSRRIRIFAGITLKITSGRIILYQREI